MERKGECSSCGWCCQFITIQRVTIPARDVTPDSAYFYQMRGGVLGEDGKLRVVLHSFVPCVNHDAVNKKCNVYEDRPQICKDFPTFPEQIEGTPCTYWFEITNENGEIERRGGLDSPYPTPPLFK